MGTEAGSGRSVEDAALDFAEDLGRFLGTTQKKAEEWLGQRRNIVDRLTQIRDAANGYLQQLSGEDAAATKRKPGRPSGSMTRARGIDFGGAATRSRPEPLAASEGGAVGDGQKRKRRGMSAAQRKAVGERMKKYWADRKKQAGKK